jgi:hypothetical protein
MAGATAPAVFLGLGLSARAQEGQLKAPHRISRVTALSLFAVLCPSTLRRD